MERSKRTTHSVLPKEHFKDYPEWYEKPPVFPILIPKVYKDVTGDGLGEVMLEMVARSTDALAEGKEPKKPDTGAGGSYLIPITEADDRGNVVYASVFKPLNEEPNQDFYCRKPNTRERQVAPDDGLRADATVEGLKEGTLAGGGAAREYASYLLDHPKNCRREGFKDEELMGFAGVPPTLLVHCINKNFNYLSNKTKEGKYRYTLEHYKLGSLQMYMENDGSFKNMKQEDVETLNLAVEEVHKISLIDIRYANVDRHAGNLLYRKVQEGETTRTVLIPIDHGYCFPQKFAIEVGFVWLEWEQSRNHYNKEFKDYIKKLDAEQDIALLEKFKFKMSDKSRRIFRLSTLLLKKAVEEGLTPFQIGKIMCRNGTARQKTESYIEMIVDEFEKDPNINLEESWNSNCSKVVDAFGKAFKNIVGPRLENELSNGWWCKAQIAAAFYPKFENVQDDLEVRKKMEDMVSQGKAVLEVTLKHSGSLFIYAGKEGGAYTKNSFGNKYTAVGLFVLRRTFQESWGPENAYGKQREFDEFLKENRMCISMELVTAVLGDHGQRPIEDYVVVTAVTELGFGKPRFYSTPDVIALCRKWRLPSNDVWLFSKSDSVRPFFEAFDELCEEGTATTVCGKLNEISDIYLEGSKDHTKVQGEILEGLVARVVSPESLNRMEELLKENPLPPAEGAGFNFGPSLRHTFVEHKSDEKEFIESLRERIGDDFFHNNSDWEETTNYVVSQFLDSRPVDTSSFNLQEMTRLLETEYSRREVKFICYKTPSDSPTYKMMIHIKRDKVFQKYRRNMSNNRGLWPLFRGFFVDIKIEVISLNETCDNETKSNASADDNADKTKSIGFADDDDNLMIKLKFLKYKIRTFLMRGGLDTLFKNGRDAYLKKCSKEMEKWKVSSGKQAKLKEMLAEWADRIQQRCGEVPLPSTEYLTEAESFLEDYASKSPENRALVGFQVAEDGNAEG